MSTPDAVPVLYVLRAFNVGGAELQLLALLEHLDRDRFPPTVVVLAAGGPLSERFARVAVVREATGSTPARLIELVRSIREARARVVHTWLARLWGTTAAALLGVPVVASFRGIDDDEAAWRVMCKRVADRTVGRRMPIVAVANSTSVADFVGNYTGIPEDRTVVIGNMLHNPDLAQLPIGRDSETFTVGVLARLELVKDHATVLRAAAEVAHLRPKIRFLVVGSGSLLDPLRREAERLGVADSCEFAGHVSDVASVLARCHATVLASRSEGSPNAIIESFAAGVPVVATATQGSRELVRDGENGFLVPVGDATALAERLVTLADDEGLRRRLGITARREMLSTAAPEAIVRRYEGLYAALATNRVPDGHARR